MNDIDYQTIIESLREEIETLRQENEELKKPSDNDSPENTALKRENEELKEELKELKSFLFHVKDETQIKRTTFKRVFDKCKDHGFRLIKTARKTFLLTYKYFDQIMVREFRNLKDIWNLLLTIFLEDGKTLFNEVLLRVFPQFSRTAKNRLRKFFPTRSARQLRPCSHCGFLINFPKVSGSVKQGSILKRYPHNPNNTPHNCLGYVRGMGLTDSFLEEVMNIA